MTGEEKEKITLVAVKKSLDIFEHEDLYKKDPIGFAKSAASRAINEPEKMLQSRTNLGEDKGQDFDYKTFRTAAAINILCTMIIARKDFENADELAIKAADKLIKKLKETERNNE